MADGKSTTSKTNTGCIGGARRKRSRMDNRMNAVASSSIMMMILMGAVVLLSAITTMMPSKADAFTVVAVSNNKKTLSIPSTETASATRSTSSSSSSSSSPVTAAAAAEVVVLKMSDGWSDFGSYDDMMLDDDDVEEEDLLLNDGKPIDRTNYATENDSPEIKQQVGASLEPPSVDDNIDLDGASPDNIIEPLFVPPGSQLELDELTVVRVLQACRDEIGTMFGYAVDNRAVGITGGVDYVGLDGPSVIIRLKGRFWHQRTTVLERVANYLQQRIPEIIDVSVEDEWQLTDEANEVF